LNTAGRILYSILSSMQALLITCSTSFRHCYLSFIAIVGLLYAGMYFGTATAEARAVGVETPKPIGISVADFTVDESDGYATAEILLSEISDQDITVTVFTFGDSALPGQDYYGVTETLVFKPGQKRTTLRIEILNDTLQEGLEQFRIGLGNARNASIQQGVATVSISDDDGEMSASIDVRDVQVNEAEAYANVVLTLSTPLDNNAELSLYTQAESATPGSDFYGRTARVSFAAGQRTQIFRVQILDDSNSEATESLGVYLVNPTPNLRIAKQRANIEIVDDDVERQSRSVFTPIEAEHHDAMSGVRVFSGVIGYVDDADWIRFDRVNFAASVTRFSAHLATPADNAGGRMEVRLGSLTGRILGTLTVDSTGGWDVYRTQSIDIGAVAGVHDLYIRFLSDRGGIANIDWFQFGPRQADGPDQPVPRELFGMHMHTIGYDGAWPTVSFAGYRIHDTAGAFWRDVEPEQDQWNWQAMDRAVSLAESNDAEILYTLGQTPAWAAADPTSESAYGVPGSSSPPAALADWRDYVRKVVERYRGRIKYYEIWNEVDQAVFYSGELSFLVSMARDARQIIESLDPQAVVIAPSFVANEYGIRKLDEYLKLNGAEYADIINVHFYLDGIDPPEKIPALAAKVRRVMRQNGQAFKPLWNTESNFGYSRTNQFITGDDALGYVARAYLIQWHTGVQRHYWYAWENKNFVGIRFVDPVTGQPTPATIAYQTIQTWMIGKTLRRCQIDLNETWRCLLTDSSNRSPDSDVEIAWNPDGKIAWPLPARAKAVRSLRGTREAVTGGQLIELGGMPVYIELSD